MRLKDRFLTQNILILIITAIITISFGFGYSYFYKLLNNPNIKKDSDESFSIIVIDDNIVHSSSDLSIFQSKEVLMNLDIEDNYYNFENNRYEISVEDFTIEDGSNYKIINLNKISNINNYYRSLITFTFIIFFISFIIVSLIIQRQNMKNIINPIIELRNKTEKIKFGDLETPITDKGYDEIRELSIAIEELRLQLKDSLYYSKQIDEDRKFLISSISHDIKTPVTAIRGYIDGILDGIADTEEKKEYYLSKAIEKTILINIMIDDLLLYSKLDLNQMRFDKEKVNIIDYIENRIEENSGEFTKGNKGLILNNKLKDEISVIIDISKFNRVVQNIIDNALRNIKEETGILEIILRETNTSVIIEFKDNGEGISEENLKHIFERFYKADASRGVGGSSGLGLAIGKQIVEGLDGRIWAISEEGKGTSIIIALEKIKEEE